MSAAPRQPKALAGVKVGAPIWSGGKRWIVCAVGRTVVHAERAGHWSALRSSWRFDGQPSRADAPAEIETPEQFAQWKAQQDAKAEIVRLEAERLEAEEIARESIHRLSRAFGLYGTKIAFPLSKALALERFIDALVREGE